MTARGLRAIACATIVAGLALAPVAHADMTKEECVAANGKGQSMRREGQLAAARLQLLACSDATCPTLVRSDCARRLDDLDAAQPTMIFDVKDGKGADVIDVRVSVDGALLADHLDGTPLRVDPGAHTFTFEVKGEVTVTRRLLVKEGESRRHERLVIGEPPASAPIVPPTVSAPPAPSARGESVSPPPGSAHTASLVLGGAAALGLGVGAIFGGLTIAAWSDAKSACGGNTSACANASAAQSDRTHAYTDATVSDVAFIAGGALAAAGLVLFFARAPREGTAPVTVVPAVGQGRAGLALEGSF